MFKKIGSVLLFSLLFTNLNQTSLLSTSDQGLAQGVVRTCLKDEEYDKTLVDRVDTILAGKPIDPGQEVTKHFTVEFEAVVQELLKRARIANGLDEFGSLHSKCVNFFNVSTEIIAIIIAIAVTLMAASNNNGHNNTTNFIYYGGSFDSRPKTPRETSIEWDVTNLSGSVAGSCLFWTVLLGLIPVICLFISSDSTLHFPIALVIATILVCQFFLARYTFGKFARWWKRGYEKEVEIDFHKNLRAVVKDLLKISRQSVEIVSKDSGLNRELNKIFCNNLPMGKRIALLDKRGAFKENIIKLISDLALVCRQQDRGLVL